MYQTSKQARPIAADVNIVEPVPVRCKSSSKLGCCSLTRSFHLSALLNVPQFLFCNVLVTRHTFTFQVIVGNTPCSLMVSCQV